MMHFSSRGVAEVGKEGETRRPIPRQKNADDPRLIDFPFWPRSTGDRGFVISNVQICANARGRQVVRGLLRRRPFPTEAAYKMLDAFEVFTTSGVVLWSRSTSGIGATAVNSLINDVFIEERVRPTSGASSNPTYKYDKYTLKYTLVKDLGLIFVVSQVRPFA